MLNYSKEILERDKISLEIHYCWPELALGQPRITHRPYVSVLCLSVLKGIELHN